MWIDIKNEKPKLREAVIVFQPEGNNVYVAFLYDHADDYPDGTLVWRIPGKNGYGIFSVPFDCITHWMTLPEKP